MYCLIILSNQKVISNMIESEDNAENKIYYVISAAILKKGNLVTFPRNFLVMFFLSKIHVLMISNLLKNLSK